MSSDRRATDWLSPKVQNVDRSPVEPGERVILTNPNYPILEYVGALVSRDDCTCEAKQNTYGTFTVRLEDGTLERSEGVINRA